MSRPDDTITLRQMLDHAREAVALSRGRQRIDLDTDRMLALALTRLVEIVGEAANRVSPPARGKHPALPWTEMVGMRDRLVHGYDEVDLDVLWNTVELDFPTLIAQLEAIPGL